ncbi:GTPase IMAP family member 1-like [Oncorhynchus kisutch]|uniref:GTPase IMAP family member 8 n=1 Tax=Oncorhynchus kisutch TaxID=8019 RepID=A0A8C7HCM3_ONCKI|nr:GTPase IMAP family member 1-like [Oncorhynchus kisutch]
MASSSGTVERKRRASISVPPHMSEEPNNSDLRIVLLGPVGAGKSATGNTILGREAFKVDKVTKACEKESREANGRKIEVLDTPGLGEDRRSEIARCIMDKTVPGPHVFLLVIRLGVKLTEDERNTVKWIQQTVGQDASDYTMILVTCADSPRLRGNTVDDYVKQNQNLQTLIDSCGGRYHSFNNDDREAHNQVTELLEKIEEMVEVNKVGHYTNEMEQNAQSDITAQMDQNAQSDITAQKIKSRSTTWGATAAALLAAAITLLILSGVVRVAGQTDLAEPTVATGPALGIAKLARSRGRAGPALVVPTEVTRAAVGPALEEIKGVLGVLVGVAGVALVALAGLDGLALVVAAGMAGVAGSAVGVAGLALGVPAGVAIIAGTGVAGLAGVELAKNFQWYHNRQHNGQERGGKQKAS